MGDGGAGNYLPIYFKTMEFSAFKPPISKCYQVRKEFDTRFLTESLSIRNFFFFGPLEMAMNFVFGCALFSFFFCHTKSGNTNNTEAKLCIANTSENTTKKQL